MLRKLVESYGRNDVSTTIYRRPFAVKIVFRKQLADNAPAAAQCYLVQIERGEFLGMLDHANHIRHNYDSEMLRRYLLTSRGGDSVDVFARILVGSDA
jgi:hypothetical protein